MCTVSEGNGHDAAISDSASAELSTAGNPATPRGFSILIADDNTVNRLLLRNQLEDRCSKITAACEGKEALHYLISERFDLVLLDLQMPGYHGLELIKKVREEHCINRDTPIVAVTAYAQTSERKNIIARGFDECLIKPILTEQLYEIVDLWKPLCPSQPNWTANKSYSGQLLEKTAHNRELAITIVNKLLDELPRQLVEIEAALDKSDFEIAREVTHKLHGSVSFCGLTALKLPAFALEQSLLDKNSSASDKYCTELKYAVQAFIEASPSTLAELSNPDMS
ncbi:MAG: response regulator [Gammaproteobacteria bacterium]